MKSIEFFGNSYRDYREYKFTLRDDITYHETYFAPKVPLAKYRYYVHLNEPGVVYVVEEYSFMCRAYNRLVKRTPVNVKFKVTRYENDDVYERLIGTYNTPFECPYTKPYDENIEQVKVPKKYVNMLKYGRTRVSCQYYIRYLPETNTPSIFIVVYRKLWYLKLVYIVVGLPYTLIMNGLGGIVEYYHDVCNLLFEMQRGKYSEHAFSYHNNKELVDEIIKYNE